MMIKRTIFITMALKRVLSDTNCLSRRVFMVLVLGVLTPLSAVAAQRDAIDMSKQVPFNSNQSLPDFKATLELVLNNDLWILANQMQQSAMEAESVAANSLPDPKLSLGLANLPTDSFEFAQEPMTQFKVGVTQVIPKGDVLELQHKKLQQMAQQQPILREQRKAELAVTVGSLWLQHFLAEQSIALINQNRSLFTQLVSIAESRYSSTMGGVRQQDIVRAQLELTRLDDRLLKLQQMKEQQKENIQRWLGNQFISNAHALLKNAPQGLSYGENSHSEKITLGSELPELSLIQKQAVTELNDLREETIFNLFLQHPSVRLIDSQVAVSNTNIELAKQSYKPDWMVNANYGYREDGLTGQSRSDFFSVGVSFDLPLFTANKQDKQVESQAKKNQSIKVARWLKLRELIAGFKSEYKSLNRLMERETLYKETLLPQINQQAESALIAYNNDDGDFAEVVRARIAELNAKIDFLMLSVEKQKSILKMNYFLAKNAKQIFYTGDLSSEPSELKNNAGAQP